jgi:hypothetical protein
MLRRAASGMLRAMAATNGLLRGVVALGLAVAIFLAQTVSVR